MDLGAPHHRAGMPDTDMECSACNRTDPNLAGMYFGNKEVPLFFLRSCAYTSGRTAIAVPAGFAHSLILIVRRAGNAASRKVFAGLRNLQPFPKSILCEKSFAVHQSKE